jgi:hypothetical protein
MATSSTGQTISKNDDSYQRFTATGRPYKDQSQENSYNSAMNAVMGSDTIAWGTGPANLLPFRYTDESTLMIAVLKPHTNNLSLTSEYNNEGTPNKKSKTRNLFRRKQSTSVNDNFDTKKVTRGDYLKYYAKDEKGFYCGTDDPAADCILKQKEDLEKWRTGKAKLVDDDDEDDN